jgi:hypothetical protein
MTKGQLGDLLRQTGFKTITGMVRGKEKEFKAAKFTADECNGGPTLTLMREVAAGWLLEIKHVNVTVPVQLAKAVNDGRIIYTPPYESWLQPIEMAWAQVKQEVRMQSRRDRKAAEVREQTREALRDMTPRKLQKLIQHVHKDITEWIQTEDAGWLQEWKSFDELTKATKDQVDQVYYKAMGVPAPEKPSAPAAEAPAIVEVAAVGGEEKNGSREKKRKAAAMH